MSAQNPQIGTIKNFIEEKGFGFITQENQTNNDIFFHIHDCKNYKPQKYDVVSFEKKPSKKKEGSFEAKNIVFLEEETKEKAQINKSKADQLGGFKVLGKIQLPTENKEIEPVQILQIPTENQTKYIGKVDWHNDLQGYGVMQHDTLGEVFFLSKSWQGSPIKKDMYLCFYAKPSTKKAGKYEAVSIWEDEETKNMKIITDFLNTKNSEKKSIFENFDENSKTDFLEVVRKNATPKQKYQLSQDGYLTNEYAWEGIIDRFLNYPLDRKNIFEKLNETEKINLLEVIKNEIVTPEQKYEFWEKGYLPYENACNGIINEFLKNSYSATTTRENIFRRLNSTEKVNFIEVLKKRVNEEQTKVLQSEGYLLLENFEDVVKNFINNKSYRRARKYLMTETERVDLLKIIKEKITTPEQKYELWKEGYLKSEDAWEEIIHFFLSSPPNRYFIIKVLNESEIENLLKIIQQKATSSEKYQLWQEGYLTNEYAWEGIADKFFSINLPERKSIFEQFNETEKVIFLEIIKEKMVNLTQKFEFWQEGYLANGYAWEGIVDKFLNNNTDSSERKTIFKKLNKIEKITLLEVVKEKITTPEEKYKFWDDGYLTTEYSWEEIVDDFLNYSWNRKKVFKKLNETEKLNLLEVVKEKITDPEKKYEFWKEGYLPNGDALEGISNKFLNIRPYERKEIFEKLNETEKTNLLEIVKEKATASQKYEFWQEGYSNNEYAWEGIVYSFLNHYYWQRKNIFEKLNETEKRNLLKIVKEKINTPREKYEFWQEGYLNNEDAWETIVYGFLNYPSNGQFILKKLNETEKNNVLEILKEKAKNLTDREKYEFWQQGYLNNEEAWGGIIDRFLDYSSDRKNIFEKLGETEKMAFSKSLSEKINNSEKKYGLWQEGYLNNEDAWEGIAYSFLNYSSDRKNIFEKFNESEKNNIWESIKQKCIQQEKEYWEQLKNLDNEQKNHFLGLFSDMPEYNILLWLYGLIEIFDFKEYAPYYFILNSAHRRAFNKKAKLEMKHEMDVSLLKKLESWQKISDEGNGVTLYEISWRSIWFKDKQIRVCMDSSEGVFTQYYYWEYAEENFNFLSEYISGRRVEKMLVYAKGDRIEKIQGLDRLEETIYKAHIEKQTKENGKFIGFRGEGMPRIPVNMLLRNVCLQYLNLLQIPNLEPVCVYEINSFDFDKPKHFDISVLYSILLPHDQVAIIWESQELEKSKATHIFKCGLSLYESIFEDIQSNIGMIVGIRSKLRSKDSENTQLQTSLAYFGNIDHDNMDFEVWRKNLHHLLPTLPTPPNYKGELQQEHT